MEKVISIIIPTLNEENGIKQAITSIPKKELLEMGYKTEVIVVDGYSKDKTTEFAKELGAQIVNEKKKGIGIAMIRGFNSSSGSIIITSDGDGTYPLNYLPNLLGTLQELKLDFLTTSRLRFMQNGAMSKRNKFGNKLLSLVLRILFNNPIEDSQSGMMIITRETLGKMKLHPNISVPQEMKIEASHYLKSRWAEVPINYYERVGGEASSGWKMGISNMVNLFRKRLRR